MAAAHAGLREMAGGSRWAKLYICKGILLKCLAGREAGMAYVYGSASGCSGGLDIW